jgi:phosphoribosylformylglycinamidine synthase
VGDFAASAHDRIIHGAVRGRPADVEGDTARHVVSAAATLAFQMPVLHDISAGGLAVALAEIAFRSGIGFTVGGFAAAELFDETPLRFVALGHGDALHTEEPHRRIGVMGGDVLDFGDAGRVDLDRARAVWRDALPRRMR